VKQLELQPTCYTQLDFLIGNELLIVNPDYSTLATQVEIPTISLTSYAILGIYLRLTTQSKNLILKVL